MSLHHATQLLLDEIFVIKRVRVLHGSHFAIVYWCPLYSYCSIIVGCVHLLHQHVRSAGTCMLATASPSALLCHCPFEKLNYVVEQAA